MYVVVMKVMLMLSYEFVNISLQASIMFVYWWLALNK